MTEPNIAAALAVICDLLAQGHALRYIAGALNRRGISTPSGRGAWEQGMVLRQVRRHGLARRGLVQAHALAAGSAEAALSRASSHKEGQ